MRLFNSHLVLARATSAPMRILRLQLVIDLHIQVPPVPLCRLAADMTNNGLPTVNGQDLLKVEHSLLPVGVFGMRTSTEADGLMAGSELYIEPGYKRMDEVIAGNS